MNREFALPVRGVSEILPVDKSPLATSGHMNNVRGRNLEGRIGIAQRLPLDKWGEGTQLVTDIAQPTVAMCIVHSVV